ncbi:MAG: hypothetical protein ACR2MP_09270 [Streptosporangiaceae bacterium]
MASWLRLSRREETWQTAEILILRHQLAVLQRRQPRRLKLHWADRALLATLLGVIPEARRHGLRLLITPDTIVRWHRDRPDAGLEFLVHGGPALGGHPVRVRQDRPASDPAQHPGTGPTAGP